MKAVYKSQLFTQAVNL